MEVRVGGWVCQAGCEGWGSEGEGRCDKGDKLKGSQVCRVTWMLGIGLKRIGLSPNTMQS